MAQSHYYLFSLPSALLDNLELRTIGSSEPDANREAVSIIITPLPVVSGIGSARACNVCPDATHSNVEDQRSHFRSDWHRYNVKIKLSRGRVVSENEFAALVDALEDSISGSASSDGDDNSGDSDDAVRTLLQKTTLDNTALDVPEEPQVAIHRTALSWFHSVPSTQLGIYNSIFDYKSAEATYLPQLKTLQHGGQEGRIWSMFMIAGGHFAGMVVMVCSPEIEEELVVASAKGKRQKPKTEYQILKHKTFHRYTTRRKQGGSQSTNDKSKGHAISAGAMLRRYGEQALRDDIRKLLSDWSEDIGASERIWFRASVANRRILWDYDDAVIQKGDARLRSFPFPTRRPTQSELLRCLTELTRPKVSHLTEEALKARDDAYLASLPKPKPQPIPQQRPEQKTSIQILPQLTPEQKNISDKWHRALEMVRKNRVDPLKQFWEKEGDALGSIDSTIPEWTGERPMTLLHIASLSGNDDVVRWLLEDKRANPTITLSSVLLSHDESEKLGASEDNLSETPRAGLRNTPYDLASTREVRNIFRRCAANHPDMWDWFGAAHVPSALSKEMEEEKEEKRKTRRKGLKEKVRERERLAKDKAPEEVELLPAPASIIVEEPTNQSTSRKLGGKSGSTNDTMGLSDEMKARVERERRARAVEARLRALGGPK